MKKVLILSLLALCVSHSTVAANYAFNNDNIAPSFDDTSSTIVLKDRRTSHPITPQELFFLTLPDGTKIHTADFKIKHIKKQDDAIVIDFTRPNSSVTVQLSLVKGEYTSIDYTITAVGQPRDVAKITFFPTKKWFQAPYVDGTITGSPIIADSFFILLNKPIMNTYAYEATTNLNVELKTPIQPGTPVSFTTRFDTFPGTNQLRRSVNQFISAVRPCPYKPYLHYNSWVDIGFFTSYTEQGVPRCMDEWNKEFISDCGVALDAFLLDNGWGDLTGRWLFGPALSNGFGKVREKTDSLHSSVGLWLPPWRGYNKPRDVCVPHAREYELETVDGELALSGASYFKNFGEQIISLIKDEHITPFKLSGMGDANSHIEGSPFASDFDTSIALLHGMRGANPNLFINLTTGTNVNPLWLFYADSIWHQGDDISLYGPGTPVQQWITYRDAETYRSIICKDPSFPLNSLMYHGIVSAESTYYGLEGMQTDSDFADQVWSYFATGTQLQELYITPSMLNKVKWDTLAKAAEWSRENASVLVNTHWIGDDPTALAVYGWVSWSKDKAIFGLRNPSDKPQTYCLDLAKDFGIPTGDAAQFSLKAVYSSNKVVPVEYKNMTVIVLQPLETLVFEAVTIN